MKNQRGLSILVLIVLSLSLISALEINLEKQTFQPRETFQATLTGNILDTIDEQDVIFYKEKDGHVKIPLFQDITKIGDTYYIYAVLSEDERDYTLKIKDVYFSELGETKTEDLIAYFNVSGEPADFNINPGFIITNKDFFIYAENNLNAELEVTAEFSDSTQTISIPASQQKKVEFSIDSLNQTTQTTIKFTSKNTSYEIPAYIVTETSPGQTLIEEKEFTFNPSALESTFEKDQNYALTTSLINLGQTDITDITITISEELQDFLTIDPVQIDVIEPIELQEISLTFVASETRNFSGELIATSGELTTELNLFFEVGEDVTVTSSFSESKTCAELGGTKCEEQGQVCNIRNSEVTIGSDGGACCLGECIEEGAFQVNWIAIVIIIIVLAIIGFFVLTRMKKPSVKSPEEILKERSKKYSERVKSQPQPKQIRGRLTRQ